MLRFDHFVIHIDNDAGILERLKKTIVPLGFPFDISSGKETQGFKTSNIWVGREYIEIVRLLSPDGGAWEPHWVHRYNRGKRGMFALFLATDELDTFYHELKERNMNIEKPRRPVFKSLFGLINQPAPWRSLYLPPIPGTSLEIDFLQYDKGAFERFSVYMKPNSTKKGITGIHKAKIYIPEWDEGIEFIRKVFPRLLAAKSENMLKFGQDQLHFFRSEPEEQERIKLEAFSSNPDFTGSRFTIENLELETVTP